MPNELVVTTRLKPSAPTNDTDALRMPRPSGVRTRPETSTPAAVVPNATDPDWKNDEMMLPLLFRISLGTGELPNVSGKLPDGVPWGTEKATTSNWRVPKGKSDGESTVIPSLPAAA